MASQCTPNVSVVSKSVQDLGEGPHWDDVYGELIIVDIDKHAVKAIDVKSGETAEEHVFPTKVGAAIPYADDPNLLVIAVGNSLVRYDREEKTILEVLVDVSEHEVNGIHTRINDAKCDPKGRIVFGTIPSTFTFEDYPAGHCKLFSFSQGDLRILQEGVSLSNGLAWSRDRGTMFYIDTLPTRELYAYDYDDEGNAGNRRVLVDFKCEPFCNMGSPDGMTIDTDDNLWVAVFGGGTVLHIDSRTGELLTSIPIPSINTTSVCFGGHDMNELYVTSAGAHFVPEDKKKSQPDGGKVFVVKDLHVNGRLPVNFKG